MAILAGWTFDPPTGTWQNATASGQMLDEVAQQTKRAFAIYTGLPQSKPPAEYCMGIEKVDPTAAIVQLTNWLVRLLQNPVMRQVEWVTLPHLRALARVLGTPQLEFTTVAVYGLGYGQALQQAAASSNGIEGIAGGLCNKPKQHASDCECATL